MRYTSFEEDKESGTVVARPKSQTDSAVRFEHGFAEWSDEDSGNWEELLAHLMEEVLGGEELSIDQDGNAVIDVEDAAQTLAESEHARSEDSARAIIDYLGHNDIVTIEQSTVTVLRPPHTYDEDEMDRAVKMYSNWAAAFDTLTERIETAVSRVEEAQERLTSRAEETTDVTEHLQNLREKREEYKQEMLSIAGDRDIDDLDEEERRKFDHAREQYYHYDNLVEQEEKQGETIPNPNPDQMDLGEIINQLESTKDQFSIEQERLRDRIRTQQLWPTEAVAASEQFTNVLSAMGNVVPKQQRMEEEDAQSVLDGLRGNSEEMAELNESSQAIAQEETETGPITES
ncbi:hypothetical protein [Halobaculum magnesiiphilum]|uniref:Uncharacterized protein n=1 Tax=Halobaculum magnesiiphilum TaxID=1017351 RepID=A0A8T8WHY6_9EURY|nr:hypothetical protein [Halobaculum magnesiiphilum]QZP39457.1 hypothetical protein K6T50_17905 [Halobaculum magnesiiphilum]